VSDVEGKNADGEEAALAMPIPLDLCTTEDHGYHLQDEAAREQVLTLRSGEAPVKSRNRKSRASELLEPTSAMALRKH
jgi:hypothetical protein